MEKATEYKNLGNEAFKNQKYEESIESKTESKANGKDTNFMQASVQRTS